MEKYKEPKEKTDALTSKMEYGQHLVFESNRIYKGVDRSKVMISDFLRDISEKLGIVEQYIGEINQCLVDEYVRLKDSNTVQLLEQYQLMHCIFHIFQIFHGCHPMREPKDRIVTIAGINHEFYSFSQKLIEWYEFNYPCQIPQKEKRGIRVLRYLVRGNMREATVVMEKIKRDLVEPSQSKHKLSAKKRKMILETIQNLVLALHEYSDIRELVGKTTVAGVVDIQETKRLSRAHKLWYQKLQLLDSSISIVEFTGFEWIKLATGVLVGDKSRIALVTETWIEAMVAGLYYFNVNVSKIDLAQQANWYLKSRLVTEDLTSMSLISDKLINLLVESKYDAFVRLCYKVDMWFGVHIHQFVSALEPILNYSENSELASLRLKTLEKYADCIALKYGNTPMWSTTLDYYYNSGVLAKFQLVISSQPVDSEVALNNLLMICDSFESPTLKVSILKKWILYCLNNLSSNHIYLALTSLSLLAPLSNHCDFVYLVFLKTLHLFINSENTLHVANQIFSLCSITDTEKAQIITSDFFIDQLIRISEFYISQSYPSLLLLLDVDCSESRYSGIPTSHSSNSEFSFDSSGPNLIWILVFIELLKSYTGLSHFPCLSLSSKAQLQDIKSKAQSILNYYYFIHNSTPNTDTESKNKKKELDFVFSPKFSYSKVGEMIRLFIDLV